MILTGRRNPLPCITMMQHEGSRLSLSWASAAFSSQLRLILFKVLWCQALQRFLSGDLPRV